MLTGPPPKFHGTRDILQTPCLSGHMETAMVEWNAWRAGSARAWSTSAPRKQVESGYLSDDELETVVKTTVDTVAVSYTHLTLPTKRIV